MALNAGVLTLTVEFAQGLKDKEWFGKQDPYAILTVGNQTFRTKTIQGGGTNPVFNETFKFNIINENDFKIQLKDEDVVSDEVIGFGQGDLARARSAGSDRQQVAMKSKSGKQHGFVSISLQFTANGAAPPAGYGAPAPVPYGQPIPQQYGAPVQASSGALQAGVITLTVEFAQGIKDKDWFFKQDPYAVVTVGSQVYRTRTAIRGGTAPVWNETFKFNVINENTFSLHIKDSDTFSDDTIGGGQGDLARVRSAGTDKQQVMMVSKSGKQHGFVSVSLQFTPNTANAATPQQYTQPPPQPYGAPPPQQYGYGAPPQPYGAPPPPQAYGAPPPAPYGAPAYPQPAPYGAPQQYYPPQPQYGGAPQYPPPQYGAPQYPPPQQGGYPGYPPH